MTPLRFKVMGPLEILTREGWATLPAPKWSAILALLLINRNQIVSMEQIIDELWGECPPAGPTKTVQVYVSRIRQSMTDSMRDRLVSKASG
jgi:DNA-binding SARP family transcriptional activator